MIRIEEVNKISFWDIIKLKVAKGQEEFIESNAQSIAESKYYRGSIPVGIYDDELLIGFAMFGKCSEDSESDRVWLDRFMIDEKFQGKGYGKRSIEHIILCIKDIYSIDKVYLSIFEENKKALQMYKDLGFEFTGELDYGGEKVMCLK